VDLVEFDPDPRRGVPGPIMRGRKNQWTDWSHRVIPGTLADLIPELDKLWDGGRHRHVLREREEVSLYEYPCRCWLTSILRSKYGRLMR
jgi:hypothetical protein